MRKYCGRGCAREFSRKLLSAPIKQPCPTCANISNGKSSCKSFFELLSRKALVRISRVSSIKYAPSVHAMIYPFYNIFEYVDTSASGPPRFLIYPHNAYTRRSSSTRRISARTSAAVLESPFAKRTAIVSKRVPPLVYAPRARGRARARVRKKKEKGEAKIFSLALTRRRAPRAPSETGNV